MVFVLIGDPIGSGFVNSLARPGGTLTGFMNVDAPMAGKWLELITEVAPKVKRVALIYNPRTSPYQSYLVHLPRAHRCMPCRRCQRPSSMQPSSKTP